MFVVGVGCCWLVLLCVLVGCCCCYLVEIYWLVLLVGVGCFVVVGGVGCCWC